MVCVSLHLGIPYSGLASLFSLLRASVNNDARTARCSALIKRTQKSHEILMLVCLQKKKKMPKNVVCPLSRVHWLCDATALPLNWCFFGEQQTSKYHMRLRPPYSPIPCLASILFTPPSSINSIRESIIQLSQLLLQGSPPTFQEFSWTLLDSFNYPQPYLKLLGGSLSSFPHWEQGLHFMMFA